jgi:hypothetical protein
MKKLLFILLFMLAVFASYGQRYASVFVVPADTTVFGKVLPSGTLILDQEVGVLYMTTAYTVSTATLLTASVTNTIPDTIASAYFINANGDTTVFIVGYFTTIYNTTLATTRVITENIMVNDTLIHNKLRTTNYSDTLAYGDSILLGNGFYYPNVWVAVDTIGIPIGKADIVIGSNGALAQVYTPYGCIVVGSLTAGKICIRKWGTSVYIRNNRWKHQRITYQIQTL